MRRIFLRARERELDRLILELPRNPPRLGTALSGKAGNRSDSFGQSAPESGISRLRGVLRNEELLVLLDHFTDFFFS